MRSEKEIKEKMQRLKRLRNKFEWYNEAISLYNMALIELNWVLKGKRGIEITAVRNQKLWNKVLKDIPHDNKDHIVKIPVRWEGFHVILKDSKLEIDGEMVSSE